MSFDHMVAALTRADDAGGAGNTPAPLAAAANADRYDHRLRRRVQVRMADGRQESFVGAFHHTFDAYDEALRRFGEKAQRIEVRLLGKEPEGAA